MRKRKRTEPEEPSTISLFGTEISQATIENGDAELERKKKRLNDKKKRKSEKDADTKETLHLLRNPSSEIKVIFAFDMSKRSSSLTIFNRSQGIFETVAFLQTKTQNRLYPEFSKKDFTFSMAQKKYRWIPRFVLFDDAKMTEQKENKSIQENWEQATIFHHLTQKLIDSLKEKKKEWKVNDSECLALIENYSFKSELTKAYTCLIELGGIIRNELFKEGIRYYEVSPTSIKKWFSGSGHATKTDMWNCFYRRTGIDLRALSSSKNKEWVKQVPHPFEDIVDSFALACYSF